jgi:flagellar motility protein MotE (MotC chaperone)
LRKAWKISIFFSLVLSVVFVAIASRDATSRGILSDDIANPKVMIDAIARRTMEIEKKEDMIRAEEEKLNSLRSDVNMKLRKLKKDTLRLENILKELHKIDSDTLAGLAKVYENMPPEEAALRLEKIESKFAIRLFRAINSRKAGKILGFVEPGRAAKLSEGYGKSLLPDKRM